MWKKKTLGSKKIEKPKNKNKFFWVFFWLFFLTFFFWPCIYETGRDYHGQHGWLPKPLRHTIRYSGGWKLGSGKVVDSSAGWSKMTFFGEQKGFLKFLCHFYNWVVGKFFLLTNPFGFFKKFFTHQVCVFKIKKSMFFYWISNGAPLMRVVLWILQKSIQLYTFVFLFHSYMYS